MKMYFTFQLMFTTAAYCPVTFVDLTLLCTGFYC